jgi:hypothetical protein
VRGVRLAVVYALLQSDRPRRLLAAHVGAGIGISLVVGLVVVLWWGASTRTSESTTTRLVVDLLLGAAALVYALVRAVGRLQPRRRDGADGGGVLPEPLRRRLRTPTVPLVAAVGLLNNLPGLYYVAALVAILETHPSTVGGIAQVLVYNLLRFVLPVAALALVVLRPERTLDVVRGVTAWARRHERVLVASFVGAVGVYLVAKALVGLLA